MEVLMCAGPSRGGFMALPDSKIGEKKEIFRIN
jgi:hypothetical protein